MATLKPCITCGALVSRGAYCAEHDPARHYRTQEHRQAQRQARRLVGMLCPRCGRPMAQPEVNHKRPLTLGGTNAPENREVICRSCNRALIGQPAVPGIA